MKDGVIADFETTEVMLNYFIKKVNGKSFFQRPRILICCPSNITQVEKNAIKEAAERTGVAGRGRRGDEAHRALRTGASRHARVRQPRAALHAGGRYLKLPGQHQRQDRHHGGCGRYGVLWFPGYARD